MKILVTGAAGFIGSHTAKALCARGDFVIGLDNFNDYYPVKIKEQNIHNLKNKFPQNFKMIKGDITDLKFIDQLFAEEKLDKVCHLAARAGVRPSIQNPFLYEEVNIRGTLNMLEVSRKNNVKNFVFASSSSVYGESTEIPFNENQKLDQPISPYAATKKACENLAYTYSHLYHLPTIGLRFFTVFGPAGRPDMAPFLFTKWIEEGSALERFGDGTAARDFTFIDDIVRGVLAALDLKTDFEIFNLGRGAPININEFIQIIENILNKKAKIIDQPNQPGDVPITYADTTKAEKMLGIKPKVTIQEGMEIFIKWYLENKKIYE